jgi:hypothetical protein
MPPEKQVGKLCVGKCFSFLGTGFSHIPLNAREHVFYKELVPFSVRI